MSTGAEEAVGDRFEIVELLGSGGSAAVYAAVDRTSGGEVALKVLHPHLATDAEARTAFLDAARRMQGTSHPNLTAVLDSGIDGPADEPVVWMAMERATGRTLASVVAAGMRPSLGDAVVVAIGLLSALEAVHGAGVVHRDITPANVMISLDERGRVQPESVRLIDFGLADVIGSDTLTATETPDSLSVRGSAAYVSPEQALGRPIDERGDLYQVGAVLYFALIGRPPFRRASVDALVRAHVSAPPPVPSVADPSIPPEIDRLVVRAMLKNPAARFASAREMLEDVLAVTGRADDERTHVLPVALTSGVADGATTVIRVGAAQPDGRLSARPARGPRSSRQTRSTRRARGGGLAPWAVASVVATGLAISWVVASNAEPASPPAASAKPSSPAAAPVAPPPDVDEQPVATVIVPVLLGLSLGEARSALADAGLVLGTVTPADAASSPDTVLSASAGEGSTLDRDSVIDLTVASGSNLVPDVAGLSLADAAAALLAAGFSPGPPGGADADATADGSTPGAGERLALGAAVTLRLRAQAIATPTPHPTAPGPQSPPPPASSPDPTAPPTPSATPVPTTAP